MNYNWKLTAKKIAKYFIIFAIPWAVDQFIVSYPGLAQITLGALLVGLANWGKHWAGIKGL